MSEEKESLLKKEFKQSDVARARNLVNKKGLPLILKIN